MKEPVNTSALAEVRGNTRWQLARDFQPNLDAVLAAPGKVIKESAAKAVTAHQLGAKTFFVKRYRHEAFAWRPLKFFFKPSQAKQEWQLAQELERRNLPVVRHVALGERWSARGLLESILITEGFAGVPLDEARDFDLARVAPFVRRLAEARVVHWDFHPANLLVSSDGGMALVDVHGMQIADDAQPDLLETEMLAQLRMTLPLPVSGDVQALAREKRRQAFAVRARRCLKSNRDFAVKKFGVLRWHVRLSALKPPVEFALRDPDAFLARARTLKAGRSSTVGAADSLVVKRFNFRRWLRPLKDVFRLSRARAAFLKAYHLELCGIATAKVLAAADERCFGFVRRGFVVMEEVPSATELPRWNGDEGIGARRVGELIARLHDEGFTHRDLKETNIVFDAAGAPQLIDLEGVRFVGVVPRDAAAANLQRLAEGVRGAGRLNRSTRLSFLLAYCRARRIRARQLFPSG